LTGWSEARPYRCGPVFPVLSVGWAEPAKPNDSPLIAGVPPRDVAMNLGRVGANIVSMELGINVDFERHTPIDIVLPCRAELRDTRGAVC